MVKFKSMQFNHTPESIVFTIPPPSSFDSAIDSSISHSVEPELIIGLRGLCHLVYYHLITFEQRQISMNETDWNTHVSFTPLYLSISPNFRYLLIATDKSMHIIVKLGSNTRVRTLTGHQCGDYGKPVAEWDRSGCHVYCNSEEEHALYVYSVAREKVVDRLKGHSGIIRGFSVNPRNGQVATASYDKSVILWDR
jgi:WD40 repeat protein